VVAKAWLLVFMVVDRALLCSYRCDG